MSEIPMAPTFELLVRNKEINLKKRDNITTGQQLNSISIVFNGDSWKGLRKVVCFRVEQKIMFQDFGEVSADLDKIEVEIPAEICSLAYLGKVVFISVRGTNNEDKVVYPTPYYRLGVIELGADPTGGAEPGSPTLQPFEDLVTRAETAAKNAKQSAVAAKSSEGNAKASEITAELSAQEALKSANKAAKSAELATENAIIAEEYAKTATIKANEASTSATNAATSATEASQSATAASDSASAAANSATEAANSASNADASAESASQSAVAAKSSEENTKASEDNAATSESNANIAREAAEKAQAAAEEARDKYPKIADDGLWECWVIDAATNTGSYQKTNVLAQFKIFKSYDNLEAMAADAANVEDGFFTMIGGDVEQDEAGRLFVRDSTITEATEYSVVGFRYIADLSGAQGVKGDTGDKGDKGDTGSVFTPTVDTDGNITWTLIDNPTTPSSQNIRGPIGETGNGIEKIEKVSGTGASGSTDDYTLTYTDGSTFDFSIYNGKDGTISFADLTEEQKAELRVYKAGADITIENDTISVNSTEYTSIEIENLWNS